MCFRFMGITGFKALLMNSLYMVRWAASLMEAVRGFYQIRAVVY